MAKGSEKYLDLVRRFPLRPIHSAVTFAKAQRIADTLADRGEDDLSKAESDYLEVLSNLIEKYEDEHYPIQDLPPAQMLGFLIEQRDITQKDLAAATELQISTISELISEKREFTANHIGRLSVFFKVSADVFVTKPELVEA